MTTAGRVVLLAGRGDSTAIVANYLRPRVGALEVVMEDPPSRRRMAERRAARVGWPAVAGQVLMVAALPLLGRRDRSRIGQIMDEFGLDATPCPPDPHHVGSVNDDSTRGLLADLDPDVVVVNGTRIISSRLLESLDCPIVNTHAGITPRYRGVHGGYWALADGRPDLVGTTVHLVDPGIDTGGVLGRAYFDTCPDDSIATYPYLHLAAGLPVLGEQVAAILAGVKPTPLPPDEQAPSRLHLHPTLWSYLARWFGDGVR